MVTIKNKTTENINAKIYLKYSYFSDGVYILSDKYFTLNNIAETSVPDVNFEQYHYYYIIIDLVFNDKKYIFETKMNSSQCEIEINEGVNHPILTVNGIYFKDRYEIVPNCCCFCWYK